MDDDRSRRHDPDDRLFIVGLVGRAGSGKSTAARLLVERAGAIVFEGDALGHEVTDEDPIVREALTAEYGPDVYRADGTLDRRRVAAKVFNDPLARGRLDRLVHPKIMERIMRRLEGLRSSGHEGLVVIDAALMLEWQLERWCDAVVAVIAAEPRQIERLGHARGWTPEEAAKRLAVQRSNEAFAREADLTLENDGSEADFERAVLEGIARLAAPHTDRVHLPWN